MLWLWVFAYWNLDHLVGCGQILVTQDSQTSPRTERVQGQTLKPLSLQTHTHAHMRFFFSIKVELSRHEKRLWKVNILLGNDKFCNGLIMFGVMVRAFTTRTPEVEADKSLWVCYLIYLESPDFQWFMHSATLSLKYKPELNKVSALYCALGSCEPGCCILNHHSLNLLLGVSCTSVSSYRDEESFLFIELLIF